jgi:hypothetical protein
VARIAISGHRIPAKSKLGKARLEELLPSYERVQARDLLKGDLIEPNEISGSLRSLGHPESMGKRSSWPRPTIPWAESFSYLQQPLSGC